MKTLGIIAEYNPIHNGHIYHLNESKKRTNSDAVVCVLSGNFIQRGLPALYDKWERTQLALNNGVDLVIELPAYFAVNSAEYFAKYGITLLNSLGIIDYLSFGTEEKNINDLEKIADILLNENAKYKEKLNIELDKGLTFAKAQENAVFALTGSNNFRKILNTPNNILGIEYLKALKNVKSKILPINILRTSSKYSSTEIVSNSCSATAIRYAIETNSNLKEIKKCIPTDTYTTIKSIHPTFLKDFEKEILYTIRKMSIEDLGNIIEVTEGLENRLKRFAFETNDIYSYIDLIKTKRFTQTKLQRILIHILLSQTKTEFKKIQSSKYSYIRVLGFNETGAKLLKTISNTCKYPVITSVNKYIEQSEIDNVLLNNDILSSNLYTQKYNIDLTQKIIKL